MQYAQTKPHGATPCGQGNLVINGVDTQETALALAKMIQGQYVNAQVAGAVQRALLGDKKLAEAVGRFQIPRVTYTLGAATELQANTWQIPFEAFVSDSN